MRCGICNNRGYVLERSYTNEIVKQPCDCRLGELERENRRLHFWEEVVVWFTVLFIMFILYRVWS